MAVVCAHRMHNARCRTGAGRSSSENSTAFAPCRAAAERRDACQPPALEEGTANQRSLNAVPRILDPASRVPSREKGGRLSKAKPTRWRPRDTSARGFKLRCGSRSHSASAWKRPLTDLTQRLRAADFRLAYVPALRLEHLKRDTADSVLRMFWNWYLAPSVLAGHFASVDTWLRFRLPWIWSDYRSRAKLDAAFPTLSLLTLALPWILVTRDLALLADQLKTPADVTPLADLAERQLRAQGHHAIIAAWTAERVLVAAAEGKSTGGGPLNPAILEAVADQASGSLQRRSFWSDVEQSAHALSIFASHS